SRVAPDVPPVVVGDPVRIRQILTNLLGNAVKFTERGSVALDVTMDRRIDAGAMLHFAVADTGIGIPADKLAAIFEPFQQGDGSMRRRCGATGLGLTIASTLAALMHGRIRVESRPGAGSAFHLTLPVGISRVAAEPREPAAAPAPAARSTRILIAEDNLVNQ